MEATRSSETSVYNKPTWHHIPEDGILYLFCFISGSMQHINIAFSPIQLANVNKYDTTHSNPRILSDLAKFFSKE
jgi:hypothetical protein